MKIANDYGVTLTRDKEQEFLSDLLSASEPKQHNKVFNTLIWVSYSLTLGNEEDLAFFMLKYNLTKMNDHKFLALFNNHMLVSTHSSK